MIVDLLGRVRMILCSSCATRGTWMNARRSSNVYCTMNQDDTLSPYRRYSIYLWWVNSWDSPLQKIHHSIGLLKVHTTIHWQHLVHVCTVPCSHALPWSLQLNVWACAEAQTSPKRTFFRKSNYVNYIKLPSSSHQIPRTTRAGEKTLQWKKQQEEAWRQAPNTQVLWLSKTKNSPLTTTTFEAAKRVCMGTITAKRHITLTVIKENSLSLLVSVFTNINNLQDVVVCAQFEGANIYLNVILQKVSCESCPQQKQSNHSGRLSMLLWQTECNDMKQSPENSLWPSLVWCAEFMQCCAQTVQGCSTRV